MDNLYVNLEVYFEEIQSANVVFCDTFDGFLDIMKTDLPRTLNLRGELGQIWQHGR